MTDQSAPACSDVVIIGGGVAALSAATELVEAGQYVTIVDKANRPGGRCATRRVTSAPEAAWFDYGAQYFTVRDAVLRVVVEADIEVGDLAVWTPRIAVAESNDDGWRVFDSSDDKTRLIGPHGLNYWVRNRLAKLPVNIRTQNRVNDARPVSGGWQITNAADERTTARQLIVTTPPAQAAAILGEAVRSIPVLGHGHHAMRACQSLVVATPDECEFNAAFVHGGHLSWIADNSHKRGDTAPERRLWTLHASPDFSDVHVEAEPDELAPRLIEEFAAITGHAANAVTPIRGHRWRYARPGDAAPPANTLTWINDTGDLALAGDWLAGGRIEGAWRSGHAAARRLISARS